MAQGDQLVGSLGGHDPGDTGARRDVAFLDLALGDELQGLGLERDKAARDSHTLGFVFLRNIDHAGLALGVEMGEALVHGHQETRSRAPAGAISARTACSTSLSRIKLSPTRNAATRERFNRAMSVGVAMPAFTDEEGTSWRHAAQGARWSQAWSRRYAGCGC